MNNKRSRTKNVFRLLAMCNTELGMLSDEEQEAYDNIPDSYKQAMRYRSRGNMSLTKGAYYSLVKSVMKWFGVNLTKLVFSGFFKNAISVVGGVYGGGITFLT